MKNKILLGMLLACVLGVSGCYSCHTWLTSQGKVPADPTAKFMWNKNCYAKQSPMPLPKKCKISSKSAPKPAPAPVVGLNAASRIYPSSGCGVVKLEKILPKSVQTGADFNYKIRVTNLTNLPLADVVVTDTIIRNFQYKSSKPAANVQGNKLIWEFPSLTAKETVEIVGIGVATAPGVIQNCVDVTYRMPLCVQSVSVQPKLVLTKTGPKEVSICEPIRYVFKVVNSGTGPANNVRILDTLPEGLLTTQGTKNIDIPVGTLMAGSAKAYAVNIEAQNPGAYSNSARAVADGGLKANSETVKTTVRKPVLKIVMSGPKAEYLNRNIIYKIDVTNTGNYPAADTVIEDSVPASAKVVGLSRGGAKVGNKVIWKVSSLNPGATAKMSITLISGKINMVANTAKASAVCADTVTATAQTKVRGISAILLEVIDIDDPVRIGNNVIYKITVTNQGSAPGTNIRIKAMLEPQMEYVSNVGATRGTFDGKKTINFAPLSSLAPKATAIWNVVIKAKAQANVRFKVTLRSDQLTRDVEETESTNFYE